MSEINGYNLTREWYNFRFENPNKAKHVHSDLYFYIIDRWNRFGQKEKFSLPTESTMEALGIRSYNTYKKALHDLIEFGFVEVIEWSKNQYCSTVIALSKNDKAMYKALDKAVDKANDKAMDKALQSYINNRTIEQENKEQEDKVPVFNFKKALIEAGADEGLVNDWMLVRKNHRATNTQTAFNAFIREVGKSGLGINDILNECVIKSWRGFDADWLDNVRRADPNFVSKVKEYKRKLKDGGYYIDDVGGWENQSEFMAYTFMVPGNNTRGLVLGNKANVERRLTERPGWERLTPVSL